METGDVVRKLLRKNDALYRLSLITYARLHGGHLEFGDDFIVISKNRRHIRLSLDHLNYVKEILDFFDFYWGSVEAVKTENGEFIDFSKNATHRVPSFALMPINFPSISEPFSTCQQYMDVADIVEGMNVIDLGAYSGLSSIVFQERVGRGGRVIAVEADPSCNESVKINFSLYNSIVDIQIMHFECAIWSTDTQIKFLAEGNMASAIVSDELNQWHRQQKFISVPAITLTTLVKRSNLERVDIIKADIEGAEIDALSDIEFFKHHHPKIILEPITLEGPKGAKALENLLSNYGYRCQYFEQIGGNQPLMLFS